jgi:hypothetical protein
MSIYLLFLDDAGIYTGCIPQGDPDMNKLPHAIASYIDAANAQVPGRVADCFSADATVGDEQTKHRGHDDIEAWARETGTRYQSVIEPVGLEEADGIHRLHASVRGNFPGSPISLHFDFRLASGRIASLEIKP